MLGYCTLDSWRTVKRLDKTLLLSIQIGENGIATLQIAGRTKLVNVVFNVPDHALWDTQRFRMISVPHSPKVQLSLEVHVIVAVTVSLPLFLVYIKTILKTALVQILIDEINL